MTVYKYFSSNQRAMQFLLVSLVARGSGAKPLACCACTLYPRERCTGMYRGLSSVHHHDTYTRKSRLYSILSQEEARKGFLTFIRRSLFIISVALNIISCMVTLSAELTSPRREATYSVPARDVVSNRRVVLGDGRSSPGFMIAHFI